MRGTIKFFHLIKGYGFIELEEGKDLFFHISELENYKQAKLSVGEEVEFEIGNSKKGKCAVKIKKIKK